MILAGEPRVERAGDRGDAVGAPGEPGLVEQKESEHFGESESYDGQIILAQSQRHERQRGARGGGECDARGPRQEQRHAADCQERGGVGADGEERDRAEVHQAR
jgi:hypothetical protein